MKESDIQANIVSALRVKGYWVHANNQNTKATSFEKGKEVKDTYRMHAHYTRIGWMKGVPDLTVVGKETNGNTIIMYIECKSPTGKVSKDQKYMMDIMKVLGVEARVVRDIDHIQDLLDKDMMNIESLLQDLQIEEDRIAEEKQLAKIQKKEQEKLAKQLAKAEKKSKSKKIQKK